MSRMNLNLCLKHGGSSHDAGQCEMCHPTRCLTHDQSLPCKTCLGQDISVEDSVKEAKAQTLEERVTYLEGMLGMAQTSIAALDGQVAVLRQEVHVLRSL